MAQPDECMVDHAVFKHRTPVCLIQCSRGLQFNPIVVVRNSNVSLKRIARSNFLHCFNQAACTLLVL
jgi:hypothetical protein